jgi:YD repeat-containing protein
MKQLRLTLPVILIAIMGLVISCTGNKSQKVQDTKTGVAYFRHLQFSETPYDLEKGTHPLTPEEAKNVNSYKFTWDDAGRLSSVEFVRNDVLLDYSTMGAAKIAYEYNGNMQTKYYYNKNNEKIESGGVYAAEYQLDNNGNRVGMMFLGKDGSMVENRNKIHCWKWSVLPDGMIKENRFNLKQEEVIMNQFCPFYELRFTYNDKGYVTRMANYMADTLYNCTAENCGDIGVSYFTFTSNDKGDLEKFEVFNVTGQMSNLYWGWSKRVSKYDENGYVIETAVFDQDDEPVGGNSVPVTRNKYDEHGALIEARSYDASGALINNPSSGVAITQYRYDEAGNRIETLTFDLNNVAVKK